MNVTLTSHMIFQEHVDDFKSVKTFKFFNTNNIWAKLDGEFGFFLSF